MFEAGWNKDTNKRRIEIDKWYIITIADHGELSVEREIDLVYRASDIIFNNIVTGNI